MHQHLDVPSVPIRCPCAPLQGSTIIRTFFSSSSPTGIYIYQPTYIENNYSLVSTALKFKTGVTYNEYDDVAIGSLWTWKHSTTQHTSNKGVVLVRVVRSSIVPTKSSPWRHREPYSFLCDLIIWSSSISNHMFVCFLCGWEWDWWLAALYADAGPALYITHACMESRFLLGTISPHNIYAHISGCGRRHYPSRVKKCNLYILSYFTTYIVICCMWYRFKAILLNLISLFYFLDLSVIFLTLFVTLFLTLSSILYGNELFKFLFVPLIAWYCRIIVTGY